MQKLLKSKFKIIYDILQNVREDHISEYSAQCAYYTILSFIPLYQFNQAITRYFSKIHLFV